MGNCQLLIVNCQLNHVGVIHYGPCSEALFLEDESLVELRGGGLHGGAEVQVGLFGIALFGKVGDEAVESMVARALVRYGKVLGVGYHGGLIYDSSGNDRAFVASHEEAYIRLFVARHEGSIVAGAVVYETTMVAHTQYLAVSDEGTRHHALDGLIAYLAEERYAEKPYLDLGTSMEPSTSQLNEGLIFQKEGFGARAVVYDAYVIQLTIDN